MLNKNDVISIDSMLCEMKSYSVLTLISTVIIKELGKDWLEDEVPK